MRTVTRIAFLAVLVGASGALGASSACKKQEAPPALPSRQGVEIINLGAMPHQPLRYQLTTGVKTAVEMEIETDIAASSFQRTMPTTVMVMELAAEDVLPDGNTKIRTTILRASARERAGADAPVEALNAQATMLSGVALTGTLTPRGRLQAPKLVGNASMPAKAAEGFAELVARSEEVAMLLPEPGVGVGAVWRMRKDASQLGIKMETVTDIEVTAIEDKRVSYVMRTEVKGSDQHVAIEGVEVDIKNVKGHGRGQGVIDLGRMVMLGEQSLELGFDIAADQAVSSMKMKTTKRMKPAADAAVAAPPAQPPPQAQPPQQAPKAESSKTPQDPGTH
ncbi:MAG TPA: hypothetical protein VNO30_42310 [Kofleriaceae bacterium]|nr:hypothetical protein [Kofleriaceae bacterium]